MFTRDLAASAFALLLISTAIAGETPKLGQPIREADIKAWDITILPDGTNLPPGKGTAAEGAALFVEKGCNACHGDNAKGGRNMALVGNPPIDRIEAPKTIANFWANATTLYDTIRRSMPWPDRKSTRLNSSHVSESRMPSSA